MTDVATILFPQREQIIFWGSLAVMIFGLVGLVVCFFLPSKKEGDKPAAIHVGKIGKAHLEGNRTGSETLLKSESVDELTAKNNETGVSYENNPSDTRRPNIFCRAWRRIRN